jgi:hypothetical protein
MTRYKIHMFSLNNPKKISLFLCMIIIFLQCYVMLSIFVRVNHEVFQEGKVIV